MQGAYALVRVCSSASNLLEPHYCRYSKVSEVFYIHLSYIQYHTYKSEQFLVHQWPLNKVEGMVFVVFVSEKEMLGLHCVFECDTPSILLVQGFKDPPVPIIICELDTNFRGFFSGQVTCLFLISYLFPEDFAGLPQVLLERWLVDSQPHVLNILRFCQSIACGHLYATVAVVDPVSVHLLVHLFG